jgi:UDP-N-acetylglucosamine 4-epimerase
MNVLITGGAGFIGSNIANKLCEDPEITRIFIIDNLVNGDPKNLVKSDKIFLMRGDICDFELVNEICERIDVICHQAAWGSVPKSMEIPKDYMLNNVCGFMNIVEAAKNNNIKKIIYASSSSVYGDDPAEYKKETVIGKPLSPYALSKRMDEMIARQSNEIYGINFYGLRYFNVFGENQKWDSEYSAVIPKFIKSIVDGESPIIYGDGTQSRDFTHVKNVVDFNIHLIKNVNENGSFIFNVAMGKTTSVNELYRIIKDSLNSDIEPIYESPRKGEIQNSLADINNSKSFGYIPSIELEPGLKMTIDWFMEQKRK